ncbi:hypothetical protein LGQ03_15950 [Loktanella sp. TSTF-M6]|uniref:Short chain dehydrogenase n=1 Tax=Loktanella gaetbuli TaxID=2881335 RepID=A0ABS8BYW7_9RHOB|nr:hypothetical protein [Loktanella gaetbuli]MCB5200731.1 hypothetical protein [Loktanella gaetbuli]
MARVLITGANRGIGAALMIAARAAGHSPIGTTRHGGDGFTALTLNRPGTVAAGIITLIDRLTMADTGRFLHFTGKERPF